MATEIDEDTAMMDDLAVGSVHARSAHTSSSDPSTSLVPAAAVHNAKGALGGRVPCPVDGCPFRFQSAKTRDLHVQAVHVKTEDPQCGFRCTVCGLQFRLVRE